MNRLATATSPYLRSHADNPVDWFAWGEEPFAEARRRGVPVLVSIGYSTCHWCHVMARESFSDPLLAEVLNQNFVSIKVDREEHPDVDASYIAAAGAFTSHLGWPLNVFVTPSGQPFYAGTYWPPQEVAGHPAFRDVLEAVLEAWRERRPEVEENAARVAEALAGLSIRQPGTLPGQPEFDAIVAKLLDSEDRTNGGFGGAPKFPVAPVVQFLLDRGSLGDDRAQALATRTLDAMAASELRDPVDGGFFRYATQRDWTEPHYERMLYDNALLLRAYAGAARAEVAEGIASFLIHVLQLPSGGFASAQDSESTVDGLRVEGGYYALDAAARAEQPPPALDGKVLTGWNGLAIEALAQAGFQLDRPDWVAAATRAADYLLEHHVQVDRLVRSSIDGAKSEARATLEDYGMLAAALLKLATVTGEVRFAIAGRHLVDDAMAASDDGTFAVPGGADPVLESHGFAMQTDPSEGAYPSGISVMASAANTLYLLTANAAYREASERAMQLLAPLAIRQPIAFGAALGVMTALTAEVDQLVVVTEDPNSPLARAAKSWHRPTALVSVVSASQAQSFAQAGFELFEGRTGQDRGSEGRAFLCRAFVCALPITDDRSLLAALPL
jgi:uncharacterized protein YyaL (SSP411 family)